MATKLKNLHLYKIDAVDDGANQRADIVLAKAKDTDINGPNQDEIGLFKRFLAWVKGEEVRKDATSFVQQLNATSLDEIMDETWDVCYALRDSIMSILGDVSMEAAEKQTAIAESVDQFATAVNGFAVKWTEGAKAGIKKGAKPELQMLEKDQKRLESMIEKSKEQKGDLEEMIKIDKSKMTADEKAFYESIVEKYAVSTDADKPVNKADTEEDMDPEEEEDEDAVDDGTAKTMKSKKETPSNTGTVDVYKSIIEGLKADIEKMKDAALTTELTAVAKKYEALGKPADEMVETLKKARAGGVYDEVIAAYDAALEAQEASGMFREIGKSREGGPLDENEAIQKAKTAAAELIKSNPNLTSAQALDQVLLNNPELMREFDQ